MKRKTEKRKKESVKLERPRISFERKLTIKDTYLPEYFALRYFTR